ncbi:m-AAA protease-interacting protein 1, mitochondrial [Lampris incognitus]|uniref:m-AAA protease-interacting protein 1, mitochondrial n=1 Tax=Lampris incognitus TaxID=2546036 RepID=UPI0024B50EBC|nr:m-AAA protease-interacting protein 1, mitochondrial [Lampris incognitus]
MTSRVSYDETCIAVADLMQRTVYVAACGKLRGFAAGTSRICPWMRSAAHRQCSFMHTHTKQEWTKQEWRASMSWCRLEGRRTFSAGQRLYSTGEEHPGITVVGIPDPITWIYCKVTMYLIEVCFEPGITSVDFDRGVKQALVHISNIMSCGRFDELRGIMSNEVLEYIKKNCNSLNVVQRQQLAISADDILFMLPEDVSVIIDQHGRKFCFVVMRFWFLSTFKGPDDPEGTKIFSITPTDDSTPKKIVTAVYEFQRELTRGSSQDWKVTHVWHWHWKLTE